MTTLHWEAKGPEASFVSPDEFDGGLAALTGMFGLLGKFQGFVMAAEGVIVCPSGETQQGWVLSQLFCGTSSELSGEELFLLR